ncbi:MAG: porin family protein [Rhizobiaceae bacterium]|nr:MAG: porin family protein [Rhizobiaceae bacterium]
MRNILLSVAALTVIAAPAAAQSVTSPQLTGSVGYTHFDSDEGDLGAISGRLNARFNQYFGVEGEASVGVKDETLDVAGTDVRVEHKYDAAVYGVATLPINPNFEVFGRVGYGTTKIEASAAGISEDDNAESWNYGVGANYFFDDRNGIRADFTRRDFTDDRGEANTYGLGYVRRF